MWGLHHLPLSQHPWVWHLLSQHPGVWGLYHLLLHQYPLQGLKPPLPLLLVGRRLFLCCRCLAPPTPASLQLLLLPHPRRHVSCVPLPLLLHTASLKPKQTLCSRHRCQPRRHPVPRYRRDQPPYRTQYRWQHEQRRVARHRPAAATEGRFPSPSPTTAP